MPKLMLTLVLTLVLVGCSKDAKMESRSECCDEKQKADCCNSQSASEPQYQVEVVIKESMPDGIHRVAAPRLIVLEGHTGTVTLNHNQRVYNIETLVKREQDELICHTKATFVRDGHTVAMPQLVSRVGDEASLSVDDLSVDIRVEPISG